MGKGKLSKFADMAANPLVVECPFATIKQQGNFALRGYWGEVFFKNNNPIVLELGCGRGEYTIGLAQREPNKNYIGIDIKGARMWTGAQQALKEGMTNVGFLRTNIEFINHFFAPSEVYEIWLTFSDPQMKKLNKRLTCTSFLNRYKQFLKDNGLIHLKTDSNFLFTYTEELLKTNKLKPFISTRSLYSDTTAETIHARSIQTYYEQMWRARGIDIKYLCFALPQNTQLIEPDMEIPLDEYRSYSRQKRSSLETNK